MICEGVDPEAARAFGRSVDFADAAADYVAHRAGFPEAFFEALTARGWARRGDRALDLGTGTGTVARGLAARGLVVTGVDPAQALMAEAETLDRAAGVFVAYREGRAEAPPVEASAFDLVTAGQCWHWFDRAAAAGAARRALRPGGRIVIAHFDWIPAAGNVVAATEALILAHNPAWALAGGTGIYPAWLGDLSGAGFEAIETFSFDVAQPYSHAAWRGRVRASAGVGGSLGAEAVAAFDRDLAARLAADYPGDPLAVPHRVWAVSAVRPAG
jgi:SAM-dependent methyltransferase